MLVQCRARIAFLRQLLAILITIKLLQLVPRFRTSLPQLVQPRIPATCKPYPGKRVVLVTVNEHYLDFFENWQLHAKPFWDEQHTQLVVSAESTVVGPSLQEFSRRSPIPFDVIFDKNWTWISKGSVEYKQPLWGQVVTHRPPQILSLVAAGCYVLYVDVDTVWLKPVFPILDEYIKSAPLVATDDLAFHFPQPACKSFNSSPYICTCFLYFSPVPRNVELLDVWSEAAKKDDTNQGIFNTLVTKTKSQLILLPLEQFPPGACAMRHNQTAVVLHANWLTGIKYKRNFFKRFGLWKVGR